MMVTSEDKEVFYRNASHKSVLMKEVIAGLDVKDGGVYIDGTFGAGGHSRSILQSADCKVIGVDRDPYTEVFASKVSGEYPNRFIMASGRFGNMDSIVADYGTRQVDGVLLDIGVSSMQIDTPRRGFSFSNDGPLDMRMDDESGKSAADFVNSADEFDLAGVIFKYGGERMSRRIARAIVLERAIEPITRTARLAQIVQKATGSYNDSINPATRTFQALRMWVNDELGELMRGLIAAERVLAPGGRLAVITFHSGEDKIVKDFLKERSGKGSGATSRYMPPLETSEVKPTFKLVNNKVITSSKEELAGNARARSAKLRIAERTDAPNMEGGNA